MYVNQDKVDVLSSLKLWICSGESLPQTLAKEFFERFSNGHVLANFYGSTEVMGDVTYHLLSKPSQLDGVDKVPIGRPMDNCIIYLVNNEMRLVPQGEVGELVVAGRNLAAGYIRGRDSTKFMSNPHAIDPGMCMHEVDNAEGDRLDNLMGLFKVSQRAKKSIIFSSI